MEKIRTQAEDAEKSMDKTQKQTENMVKRDLLDLIWGK